MKRLIIFFCITFFIRFALFSQTKPTSEKSGNPVFPGWYADTEAAIFNNTYWIYPTYSAPYDKQVFFDAFSSANLVDRTKHSNIKIRQKLNGHIIGTNTVIQELFGLIKVFRYKRFY